MANAPGIKPNLARKTRGAGSASRYVTASEDSLAEQSVDCDIAVLVRIFADLREQCLAAAEQFPGFHVAVFKNAPGLAPPACVLTSSFGPFAFPKYLDGDVSRVDGEFQTAGCDKNPAARRRYETLASAAGTNLPLDRFPARPVLPAKSHVQARRDFDLDWLRLQPTPAGQRGNSSAEVKPTWSLHRLAKARCSYWGSGRGHQSGTRF